MGSGEDVRLAERRQRGVAVPAASAASLPLRDELLVLIGVLEAQRVPVHTHMHALDYVRMRMMRMRMQVPMRLLPSD